MPFVELIHLPWIANTFNQFNEVGYWVVNLIG